MSKQLNKQESLPAEQPAPHQSSRGERLFDWLTYGGIAGVGTFLLTVKIAYDQKYGGGDKKLYHKMTNGLRSIGFSPKVAKDVVETTNLMHGGNLMVLPVAGLEYFKKPIVRGINAVLNEPPDASVQEGPQQTFWSLLKGRMVAWSVVFASMFTASEVIGPQMKNLEHRVGSAYAGFKDMPIHEGSMSREAFATLEESAKEAIGTKPYRLGRIAALDVFATAAAAALLYIGSHFFAKKAEQKRESKIEHAPADSKESGAVHRPTRPVREAETSLPAVAERPQANVHAIEHHAPVHTREAQVAAQ